MKRWVPTREELRNKRWLRPIAHYLEDEHLWKMDRQSVARAVGIGLFFGLLIPFAQFLFAICSAIVLRANVALAAACTLVTNPLTFTPIYWFAYQLGSWILGPTSDDAVVEAVGKQTEVLAAQTGWLESLWYGIQSAGAPLVLGLAVLATVGSLLGFTLVWLLWRPKGSHHS